jgi:beta-1,4-mannosyltransferase
MTARTIVLIPHLLGGNIYVRELGKAYRNLGCDVVYSSANFHQMDLRPDLLHVQWPEALYSWTGEGSLEHRCSNFIQTLDRLRRDGCRIVWTVHNLRPHELADAGTDEVAYQALIDRADVMLHHCPKSMDLLKATYRVPDRVTHIVTPHGHYLGYRNDVSRADARARLKIPEDAFVYLHFGYVRLYKGVDRLLRAFARTAVPTKFLLIAGQYGAIQARSAFSQKWMLRRIRYFSRSVRLMFGSVASDEVQYYVQAADALVLSHTSGLNSGVAVLGMTFGKIVIGPDIGCIGWVLKSGRNLSYDPSEPGAMARCMEQAYSMDLVEVSAVNREVARSWDWNHVAESALGAAGLLKASNINID